MWRLRARLDTGGKPDVLTQSEHAEFDYPSSQAEYWVFDPLICTNKMADKFSLFSTASKKHL